MSCYELHLMTSHDLTSSLRFSSVVKSIDYRILNSGLNTIWGFRLGKCPQFSRDKKMADTSKDGLLLGGGINHITTTSKFTRGTCLRAYIVESRLFSVNFFARKNI